METRKVLLFAALMLTQCALALTVKVGTFNVRLSSNGNWIADVNTPNAWVSRKEGFVQVFRNLDADVWGLQEVCPDQTAYFEKHLPEWEFVGDYRMADRKSGEASSVAFKKDRFDVIEKGTFWLSETPDVPGSMSWNTAFPRVCSYVFLKDRRTGAKFCFANTHLDHKSEEARKRGIELIVKRMRKIGNGVPIIFTGDHNCARDAEPAKIARTLLKDAADITEKPDPGPHRTYHNWGDPKRQARIDYIYVSDGIRVLDYATRDDRRPGTDLYPSDHFPIIATLLFSASSIDAYKAGTAPARGE